MYVNKEYVELASDRVKLPNIDIINIRSRSNSQ
jgi:hypothetical protein